MQFHRFAVYDPGPAALAAFGADWLGWDALSGRAVPATGGALTDTPRRYGFHATIKAPFRLAAGQTPDALATALEELCGRLAPVALPQLTLAFVNDESGNAGGFLALVPRPQPAALTTLAARVVAELDRFRAPLSPAEIARRDPARLDETGRANLSRWGYPHVMEAFRYHMTLTGRLDARTAGATRAALGPRLAGLLPDPHPVSTLALMGEDDAGRFHLVARCALRGAPSSAFQLTGAADAARADR